MKTILFALILLISFSGCSLNPKVNPNVSPKINNEQGTIDELKTITNGMNAEIGKLKAENSQLKEVQQGLLNMNAAFSRNENSGVQILQGDGGLILVFSVLVIAMLLVYHFRSRAITSEKSLAIMSAEVDQHDNLQLKANILKAAMHTGCEKKIYKNLFKQRI